MTSAEFTIMRENFIREAEVRHTKREVKAFLATSDKRFGTANIAEYWTKFNVKLADGSIWAWSGYDEFYNVIPITPITKSA